MTFCPFCGVRQDVNLRQIHFRDLGTSENLPCPSCAAPLGVIEFDTEPKIQIERCAACYGTFFNPGELEALLEAQTNPLVWLDPVQLNQIADDFGYQHEVVYRKCPVCAERMSHLNFGGRSGVILDRCGTHGVWLEGSELRRLTEWWRAGGKLIHQQHEAERAKNLYGSRERKHPRQGVGGIDSPDKPDDWSWTNPGGEPDVPTWLTVIGSLASIIID